MGSKRFHCPRNGSLMDLKKILTFPPLEEGILLRRYKRFMADVELPSGQIVTTHCANTGPMKGVLQIGGRVRIRYVNSPKRKLAWTWEQAELTSDQGESSWVGVNTALPNTLVKLAIQAGFLKESLGAKFEIRQEVPYGKNLKSRIDLFLRPESNSGSEKPIYLEVKNTTWKEGSVALFPDTVTIRGQKHLEELMYVLPKARAVLVPCLSRSDVDAFAPGDSADPKYGELFRKAITEGVEVFPCCFGFHRDGVTWEGMRPVRLFQK